MQFWQKIVIDGFEVVIDQKIFWQNFGWFGPFPVGVLQRSSGGQNFKMLQMTFHVYQITCEVIRITKIYSLLCIGCMVRKIKERSSKGQVGSNFQQHLICMNDISNYSSQLEHSKNIYFSYLSFHFWNKPTCLNSDHDCSGRSTQVQNGDYWFQEIDNPHNSVNHLNWFCLAYDYSHQIWI